ncbi:hypothetical protein A3736_00445 [Erythrobacter sp. HI0063]|jgi:AcrR family transcriptional regulator|uniref:TetR/AcrR family transcriptional regulator n=1 Tax=Erythrobacter sp. HI0063 TaxID=1822240 RepID=UPI0007C385DE|nr:TetR/AcrR family transcriptional regulator [Erythrobacter sp. HI0063]KZY57223.1 hypothetical protein A3736_00445 [Erythrobacter sp. HI0063]
MPRVRAKDYDEKAKTIMDKAAALFSEVGYANAKLQAVATACGATKSMLYHYFSSKDDLLSAMLTEHLDQLLSDIEDVGSSDLEPEEKFRKFIVLYVQKSNASRQRHVSAMNDVKYLPEEKREPLIQLERDVIEATAQILASLRPDLPRDEVKTRSLLLLGMLNWTDLWYDPAGRLSPDMLCDRIGRLFLDGYLNV